MNTFLIPIATAAFSLGTFYGAIATRLQWNCFKNRVEDYLTLKLKETKITHSGLGDITDSSLSVGNLPKTAKPCGAATIADQPLPRKAEDTEVTACLRKKLLAMEALRQEICDLHDTILLMEQDPRVNSETLMTDQRRSIPASIEVRYESWLT